MDCLCIWYTNIWLLNAYCAVRFISHQDLFHNFEKTKFCPYISFFIIPKASLSSPFLPSAIFISFFASSAILLSSVTTSTRPRPFAWSPVSLLANSKASRCTRPGPILVLKDNTSKSTKKICLNALNGSLKKNVYTHSLQNELKSSLAERQCAV